MAGAQLPTNDRARPVPHMVVRHYPAGHNLMNQYVEARTAIEQNGWVVKDDNGVSGWAMDKVGAVRAYERMVARA